MSTSVSIPAAGSSIQHTACQRVSAPNICGREEGRGNEKNRRGAGGRERNGNREGEKAERRKNRKDHLQELWRTDYPLGESLDKLTAMIFLTLRL